MSSVSLNWPKEILSLLKIVTVLIFILCVKTIIFSPNNSESKIDIQEGYLAEIVEQLKNMNEKLEGIEREISSIDNEVSSIYLEMI